MIDIINATVDTILEELYFVWSLLPPSVRQKNIFAVFVTFLCYDFITAVDFQPCTKNGITNSKTVGEERSLHITMDNVQPKRKLAKFYCRRIKVNSIDIMSGNVGFYPLNLITS